MSKNISISDELYEKLKREKGERSFSELIADRLEAGATIAEVTGEGVLDPEAITAARRDIDRLSAETLDRLDNEAH